MPKLGSPMPHTAGPEYGDAQTLEALASGLKHDQQGNMVERGAQGRPPRSGGSARVNGSQGSAPAPSIPEEHRALMRDYSRKLVLYQRAKVAAEDPTAGPWARLLAELQQGELASAAMALFSQTPFFQGQ